MIEISLSNIHHQILRNKLIGGKDEGCAILYANQILRQDGTTRLLVHDLEFPSPSDYTRRGPLEAELKPEFVARITKRARRFPCALIFVHSHPGTNPPVFSPVDTRGEQDLAGFLSHRHPTHQHAAIVISQGGICARRLGTEEYCRVITIGENRDVIYDPMISEPYASKAFDRQVRAFGIVGQQALSRIRVAIVGLGGTGSLIAQQLVHLGIQSFILIDPDTIEETNLNRVVNATKEDISRPKVEVARRYIRSVSNKADIEIIQGDIIHISTARKLANADIIFGCTDSHGSRAIIQQVSYQYLIPCIDMGVTIIASDSQITHIFGRIQLLAPGLPCLTCGGLLNSDEVRRDMMTEFERQADPYIQGVNEAAPAVISFNGTVASLAVTMMLSMVTGIPCSSRHIIYNAKTYTLRNVGGGPKNNCYICSPSGHYARGDSLPLLGRKD